MRIIPVCAALFIFVCAACATAEDPKPNILFILADDLGLNGLSCCGNKFAATPNLDRLASEGMRFTQAYADSQCSPSRAAFFTGQFGARTGLFKVLNEKEPPKAVLRPPEECKGLTPQTASLASTLRSAGYATGISGKWHIADNSTVGALLKRDGGKYLDRYGFDFGGAAGGQKENKEDKAARTITDDIIGFIEQNKGRPWFAFVAHFIPHAPLAAPEELIKKYEALGYKRSPTPGGKFTDRPTADYLAMLEHMDAQAGRLLDLLDKLHLADNTVVVFSGDNGGLSRVFDNSPLREGKGSPYEGGIRVPFIVRWPGQVKPGTTSDVPVHFVDLYPTFAAIAGAKPPEGHIFDGQSLLPLLLQKGTFEREALYWHMPTYTTNYGRTPCSVIHKGDWKLIHWFGDYLDTAGFTPDDKPYGTLVVGPRTELYNLRDDPGEKKDLAAAQPAKTEELLADLQAWWKKTGAKFPEKNPGYDAASWWKGTEGDAEAGSKSKNAGN